jgi:hypothetical protein
VGDDVGAELDDDAAGGGDVLAGAHRRECATAGGTRERYEEGDSGAVATGASRMIDSGPCRSLL